ncbi:MAG TPA: GGDEF domain-containing protein [Phycisphaerae bacterium]|nr:GGDEF domain-containing protein [Phycisphaerae bacterium]HRY70584.1 GGDEF domain-containing protein [Phycisphaerae bacterium]HSA28366.1 GGDEF domain-containing protein [Phycisphaerae bacterium]
MADTLLERIQQADNLPSLPTVALQVLQLTQNDEFSILDLARIVQQDPALTSKLLRVVNSSLFGMSRRIASIQQAMVILGLRSVKVIVLSFSLVDIWRRERCEAFDYAAYWRRSLTMAVLARLLAERTDRSMAEECLVGGLLADIGILAAVHCAADLYLEADRRHRNTRQSLPDVERAVLGVSHEELTTTLLNQWGLPESLSVAVSSHHSPVDAPVAQTDSGPNLSRLLRAASILTDALLSSNPVSQIRLAKKQVMDGIEMSLPDLDAILDEIDQHVRSTAQLFDLEIEQSVGYQEIQKAALNRLAQLSMAAELERVQAAHREQEAQRKVKELNAQNRQLVEKASTDVLTGIANRAALDERLEEECTRACTAREPIGVIILDLDRFKKLNDTFGHQTGDEALTMIGGVLRQVATDQQYPGRYGGEEFVLIVRGLSARQLRALAEDLRLTIAKLRIPCKGHFVPITASLGVAHMNPDDPGLTPREILKRADQCLYDAKNHGRNRVVCLDSRQAATMATRSLVPA